MDCMKTPKPRHAMLQPVDSVDTEVSEHDRQHGLSPDRLRVHPGSQIWNADGRDRVELREHDDHHAVEQQSVQQPRENVRPQPLRNVRCAGCNRERCSKGMKTAAAMSSDFAGLRKSDAKVDTTGSRQRQRHTGCTESVRDPAVRLTVLAPRRQKASTATASVLRRYTAWSSGPCRSRGRPADEPPAG